MKTAITRTLLGLAIIAAVPAFAATNTSTDNLLDASALEYASHCRVSARFDTWNPTTIAEAVDGAGCVFFTRGVMGGLDMANEVAKRNGYSLFDRPDSATVEQIMLLTIRYIDRHPEELHVLTVYVIAEAVREAFPPASKGPVT